MAKQNDAATLLDTLKGIRAEVLGKVDDSVIKDIDARISVLEKDLESGSPRLSDKERLAIVAFVLSVLPDVVELIRSMCG